jgi:hypothetical protein
MSTLRSPVGPQPNKVYWRRRLLLLLGALVVILIVVLLIIRPSESAKPAGAHTPGTHTSSAPHTATTAAACAPSKLDVEAVTDAVSYASGVDPKLSLTITNTGTKACTFKVGSDVQIYTISSGTEKIWSSKDCQQDGVSLTRTLQPGTPVKSTPFAWDRTRSSTTTCDSKTPLPQVVANGASYHLGVSVNGVASKKSRQFILN